MKQSGANVSYIHQDSLSGTSVISDSSGNLLSAISYQPFGQTLSGSVPTDIKFTGQRLDSTGLYYYGARYYDAEIGRFISPDTDVPDFTNPQALNRYSYVLNNPLRYTDPTGNTWYDDGSGDMVWIDDNTPPPYGFVNPYEPPSGQGQGSEDNSGDGGDSGDGGEGGSGTSGSGSGSGSSSATTQVTLPASGSTSSKTGSSGPTIPTIPKAALPSVPGTAGATDGSKAPPREDIAGLAFETLEMFGHQALAFAMSGVVFGVGLAIAGIGIGTSPTGVGIGVAVGGIELMGAGGAGMLAVGYGMKETWNNLDFGNRWRRALGW